MDLKMWAMGAVALYSTMKSRSQAQAAVRDALEASWQEVIDATPGTSEYRTAVKRGLTLVKSFEKKGLPVKDYRARFMALDEAD